MREDWDNLSHGPTYEEPAKEIKEQTTRQKEAEEHIRIEEAKANITASEESKKSDDEVKEEDKKVALEAKDKKPSKEENLAEGSNNGKQPPEEKKKEKAEQDLKDPTKATTERPLINETKAKEKKVAKRSEEEKKTESLIQAENLAWKSFAHCRQVCKDREDCFQYVYYGKTCKLGLSFRLGKHVSPSVDGKIVWRSGWMVDRIRNWTAANACNGPEWPDIR